MAQLLLLLVALEDGQGFVSFLLFGMQPEFLRVAARVLVRAKALFVSMPLVRRFSVSEQSRRDAQQGAALHRNAVIDPFATIAREGHQIQWAATPYHAPRPSDIDWHPTLRSDQSSESMAAWYGSRDGRERWVDPARRSNNHSF